jgi:hypothetical protein
LILVNATAAAKGKFRAVAIWRRAMQSLSPRQHMQVHSRSLCSAL